ncbi:hypothetical protein KJ688_11430 [bacterium]|nr:hypothetical protein [bacterium]
MKFSIIRVVSQSIDIDEIDTPNSLDGIKQFIGFLEENKQSGVFHLTFHGKHLQKLIESDSTWIGKLDKLCEQKKILLGPWYLQPNDCLASGETLVRNLYFGNRICYHIGNVMKVGFSALSCNNNSQLPQIFNGFNIDTIFIPVTTSPHLPREFFWEGTDGSKALVISNFIIDADEPIDYNYLADILQYLTGESETASEIPVMIINGLDADLNNTKVSEIINYLSQKGIFDNSQNDVQAEYISLPDHFWKIKEIAAKNPIKTLTREVIPNPRISFQKSTINYLRIISKNSHAEQGLQFYSEPWDFIRFKTVGKSSFNTVEDIWKQLLTLQFNTNNCANSDHRRKRIIRSKYSSLIKNIDDIYLDSVRHVLNEIQLPDVDKDQYFSIVNPLPYVRTQIAKVNVELPSDIALDNVIIEDLSGNNIPSITLAKSDISQVFEDQNTIKKQQYSCVLDLKNIPAMGYKTFKILPVRKSPMPSKKNIITDHHILENDYIRVTINDNGTFNVYSKETGVSYKSLGYFIDRVLSNTDSKHPQPKIISTDMSPTISRVDNNMLFGSYKIEYNWVHTGVNDSKRTKISIILSLDRLSRSVDINFDLVDATDNHQIEYFFPINFKVDHIYSDIRFDIQDVIPIGNIHNLSQFQVALNTLVGVCDDIAGFAIISKEVRSVYITTRRSPHLSMTVLTKPESQEAGSGTTMLNYTFSFYPYIGGWENGQILRDAYNKLFEVKAHMLSNSNGLLPPQMEFLNISPSNLCFSALKTSENGNAILRLFNPTVEFIEGSITTHYPLRNVYNLSLEEYRVESVSLKNDRVISLLVPPKKIITLELVFKDG